MNTNKMREQFEAWALARFINSETMNPLERNEEDPGEYRYTMVNMAWVGWQASRQAVEIELPELERPTADGMGALFACKRAIEAQGLRVKP